MYDPWHTKNIKLSQEGDPGSRVVTYYRQYLYRDRKEPIKQTYYE